MNGLISALLPGRTRGAASGRPWKPVSTSVRAWRVCGDVRSLWRRQFPGLLLLCGVILAGCGAGDSAGGAIDPAVRDLPDDFTNEIVLSIALNDTLRGNATFGRVLDPVTNERRFVIRMMSGYDFGGGLIIARRSPDLPEPGTYGLAAEAASLAEADPDQFVILYREGMARNLRSTRGTLTLSVATDTLLVGRFEATLRGFVGGRGVALHDAEVHAVGRFRAYHGMPGYVIGL